MQLHWCETSDKHGKLQPLICVMQDSHYIHGGRAGQVNYFDFVCNYLISDAGWWRSFHCSYHYLTAQYRTIDPYLHGVIPAHVAVQSLHCNKLWIDQIAMAIKSITTEEVSSQVRQPWPELAYHTSLWDQYLGLKLKCEAGKVWLLNALTCPYGHACNHYEHLWPCIHFGTCEIKNYMHKYHYQPNLSKQVQPNWNASICLPDTPNKLKAMINDFQARHSHMQYLYWCWILFTV